MTEQELEQALAEMNERLLRLEYHDDMHIFHDKLWDSYYHMELSRTPRRHMDRVQYEREFAEWRREHNA